MAKFVVTFGMRYADEPHPAGDFIDPLGWIEVEADDEWKSRLAVLEAIGREWAFIYSPEELVPGLFPAGCIGRISDGRCVAS